MITLTQDALHRNGFGALRLAFASAVIFAHCPELLDGDRKRELLTNVFGTTLTLGSLAVDGFFLISGYLITASFSSDPKNYALKRILRIYPAFLMATLICTFFVEVIGGRDQPVHWKSLLVQAVLLQPPPPEVAFLSLPVHNSNGSLWTIAYEFRCYIWAAVAGVFGLYQHPRLFAGLAILLLLSTLLFLIPEVRSISDNVPYILKKFIGEPGQTIRLTAVFTVGASFRLLHIPLRGQWAAASALALIPFMFFEGIAEVAYVLLGGYIIFWVALSLKWRPLLTINTKSDISYGVYLYAWPTTNLLIWCFPNVSLPSLLAGTFLLSYLCGYLSWNLLEKHMTVKRMMGLIAAVRSRVAQPAK